MMAEVPGIVSQSADSGGESDGLRQLRQTIAESVMARLSSEIPGLSPHLGEHYENADDPEVRVYRSSGASFRWLAFAFSPWRMWDLHVGVVSSEHRRLSVGFHISERASTCLMSDLKRLGAEIDAPVLHQPVAVEYQANLPLIDVDDVPIDTILETVTGLCRSYAKVARVVRCPVEMRDDRQ